MEQIDMSSPNYLSSDDYCGLPDAVRAYVGNAENDLLTVTPASLKFPRNDPSLHLGKLVLWNKTKKRVDFRLSLSSHSSHFSLLYEKNGIYAGAEETVLVKVRPYDQRLISSTLKIQVRSVDSEARDLLIPIELFPDASWFQLPRIVIMPSVPIGKCFDAVLTLPRSPVKEEEGLYYFVTHGNTQAISVSPLEGYILDESSANTGVKSLKITYHPREYTTISHSIFIHFPSIQKRPYEITLYLKSNPTTFERQEIRTFPPIRRIPPKPTKLKRIAKDRDDLPQEPEIEDLSTVAAVAKFLMRPASSIDVTGALGLTPYEEHRAYKAEEKKFYEKVAQFQTMQQNLHLQPSRAFIGQKALEEESEAAKEIMAERDKQRFLYDKSLGLGVCDLEDLTRRKPKLSRRRGLRDLDAEIIPAHCKPDSSDCELVKRHILRPFIQAALTLITRHRAAKRIVKLRVLIKQKRSEMAATHF